MGYTKIFDRQWDYTSGGAYTRRIDLKITQKSKMLFLTPKSESIDFKLLILKEDFLVIVSKNNILDPLNLGSDEINKI